MRFLLQQHSAKFTEPLRLSGHPSAGLIEISSTPVRDEGFVWLVTWEHLLLHDFLVWLYSSFDLWIFEATGLISNKCNIGMELRDVEILCVP